LYSENLESPDIRAGMSMLLAALAAKGKSTVRNIGQIERGYQDVDAKLKALGAHIERVED
jgi:UDP-N-acetylglucosamine 1-carboxyvinyltransferase